LRESEENFGVKALNAGQSRRDRLDEKKEPATQKKKKKKEKIRQKKK
jgi:hypothetical protein